ncbi:P-loop containing nucleoside triphosphate hydrolase protein [Aspergillus unguis]
MGASKKPNTSSAADNKSDQEGTAGFLNRMTFSWADPILYAVNRTGELGLEDLPPLPGEYSASGLQSAFFTTHRYRGMSRGRRFALTIWHLIRRKLPVLVFMGVCCIALGFAPQAALFGLLRAMEESRDSSAWAYVLALCVPLVGSAVLDHRRYWISYRSLALRLQNHLMVALFDKAIALDGVSGSSADREDSTTRNAPGSANLVNLMAVDVKRVADFVLDSFSICETPIRLLVSSIVLAKLVGWQSLLLSVLLLLLLWPLNNYTMKQYSTAQKTMLDLRDRKLTCVTEALHGIRQIKFSAMEAQWEEKINGLRAAELEAQRKAFQWNLVLMSFYLLTPTVLSTVLLTAYSILHESLSPATAFTAMSVLYTMQNSLNAIPGTISAAANCMRSAERLSNYLDIPERIPSALPSTGIAFHGATLAWRGQVGSNTAILTNVDMSIPENGLTLITGPTGAGKSLLLAAILGECDILAGTVRAPTGQEWDPVIKKDDTWLVNSSVAYVSQTPWIEARSIRDNILFGLPYNPQRYTQVISACALDQDLLAMPDGDGTQLGANGVNLSGGQKARLCLARALYSRAAVLLLDDVFSAVDVHTAAHLCRTRVLVTHHVSLCFDIADGVVCVEGGTACFSPLANTKQDTGTDHQKYLSTRSTAELKREPVDQKGLKMKVHKASPKYVDDEARGSGAVKWGMLQAYIQQSGTWAYWSLLVIAFLSYSALMLSRTWWLSIWGKSFESPISTERHYFAMMGSLKASRRLFHRFLHQVLRAPLRWTDTVPVGRVLNRFSNDFNLVDSQLGDDVRAILSYGMDVLMAVVPNLVINPRSLVSSCILGLTTARYAEWYLVAAREIKRLDGVVRSPIYEHVETCLAGLWTIRAFGKTRVYQNQFRQLLDRRVRTQWYGWLFNQWLAFRLDLIGAVFTASCAVAVVLLRVEASAAGFAINFTLKLTQSVSMGIRSVERILEYCHMETESDGGNPAPAGWPHAGALQVRDLTVRYAPDTAPALQNVSFSVERNQRIGIVGRTGAGKSSLALALFRILEPSAGQILIDGVDISTIRLHDLRSRLAIIPQSPFLFKGTLRSNLDPFNKYHDSELLSALERVSWDRAGVSNNLHKEQTGPLLGKKASSLEQPISDGGSNLSHGQRQLLCLARALIRMPRLLILDEATSAVDKATDQLVQGSLRSEFGRNGTTLLVVAHRLSTVADFDRVLVLGGGEVLEFGRPVELMRRVDGVFRGMVERDAERDLLRGIFGDRFDN